MTVSSPPKPIPDKEYIPYQDNEPEIESTSIPDDVDPIDDSGQATFEKPITDQLIHAELQLSQGEQMKNAKVIARSKDPDGNTVGTYDHNPLLNSMVYDV